MRSGRHSSYAAIKAPPTPSFGTAIVSNDRDEIWFISNRHFRTWELRPQTNELRVALSLGGSASLDTSHLSH